MLAIETAVRRQDKHFGKLLGPVVGLASRQEAIERHLEEQDRKIGLICKGVDRLLKGGVGTVPGGMDTVEAEETKG